MVAVLTLVVAFRSSTALAYAFGMAVTGTITITTLLFFYIARHQWGTPLWLVVIGAGFLLTVDLFFLAANGTKVGHGAWLPVLIAVIVFIILTTWRRGREIVMVRREREEGPLRPFLNELYERVHPVDRVRGTGVFLSRHKATTPLAMRASVEHFHALHEHVVILSIETLPVPYVPLADRLAIDDLGYTDDGITHASARFGYMEVRDVPAVLRLIEKEDLEFQLEADLASYVLSKVELVVGDEPDMARWRKHLFLATYRLAGDASEYFRLPRERTVILGSQLPV
jgi:KUP system potassium uptake protein